MIKYWTNSVKNLINIIFTAKYSTAEGIAKCTELRYGEPLEIDYYRDQQNWHILPEEKEAIDEINSTNPNNVLLVGCGAGREFKYLEASNLYGVDSCKELLDECKKNYPNIHIAQELNQFKDMRFDHIYVSYHVYNHIQGKANRKEFLALLKQRLVANGVIYLFVDTFKLADSVRFLILSYLLRVRWLLTKVDWEHGDTIRTYNGDHNPFGRAFIYHYFEDKKDVGQELLEFNLQFIEDQNYWKILN